MKNVLYCPLCKKELKIIDATYKCLNNHSYDISRKGYVNLLLANQHHSDNSGDDKNMILSRVRFLNTGKYDLLKELIFNTLNFYVDQNKLRDIQIGDLGCGDGYYTLFFHQNLCKKISVSTYGIDLSKQAINECSIRKRREKVENISFVIGNLNYLPIADQSLDFIVNSFSKIDENEFYRVLKTKGYFLRILPGKNHLFDLKKVIYDEVRLNEEKEKEIPGFILVDEINKRDVIELNNQEINDLFTMTPYYYKSSKEAISKLLKMDYLKTQIEFKILVYQKI